MRFLSCSVLSCIQVLVVNDVCGFIILPSQLARNSQISLDVVKWTRLLITLQNVVRKLPMYKPFVISVLVPCLFSKYILLVSFYSHKRGDNISS